MTKKELQEVKQEYKKQIRTVLENPRQDTPNWIVEFCLSLADEMCYNHHERGQRLWTFSQALYEVEDEYA